MPDANGIVWTEALTQAFRERREVKFDPDPYARTWAGGKHKYFTPARAVLLANDGMVSIEVYSKRLGDVAPFSLHLTPQQAHELAFDLVVVAGEGAAQQRRCDWQGYYRDPDLMARGRIAILKEAGLDAE